MEQLGWYGLDSPIQSEEHVLSHGLVESSSTRSNLNWCRAMSNYGQDFYGKGAGPHGKGDAGGHPGNLWRQNMRGLWELWGHGEASWLGCVDSPMQLDRCTWAG